MRRVSGRNNSLCKGPEVGTSLDLGEQTENQYVCVGAARVAGGSKGRGVLKDEPGEVGRPALPESEV